MEFQKLAKKILGSGQNVDFYEAEFDEGKMVHPGSARFYKRGGHGGANQLHKMHDRAVALGFKKAEDHNRCTPDGSHVNYGDTLVHPDGHTIQFNFHYGVTAYENSFSATLNEAHNEDSLAHKNAVERERELWNEQCQFNMLRGAAQTAKMKELGWRRTTAAERRAGEVRDFHKIGE